MNKKIALFLCAVTVFLAFGICVKAGIPVEVFPWEIVFEDSNMIFYMTPPQLPRYYNEDISEERMQIKTGLYYNETPLRNIYYTDIVAHWNSVIFSDCGNYIATIQDTTNNFNQEALGEGLVNFFDNGILIKSYEVNDLIYFPGRLPFTFSGIFWLHSRGDGIHPEEIFSPATNELTLITYEERTIVFDITNGMIIQGELLNLPLLVSAGIGAAIIFAILLIYVIKKKLAIKKNSESGEH